MKIKKIEVSNLKAVSNQTADFNGCSAIITAGNNKGKTTMLKALIDRFRSQKPEIILKEGETNGNYVMELTDGSRIEWKFTEKTESFSYTTKDGIKMTTGVLKAIGEKYFGIEFDIDKFLQSSPKSQSSQIAKLVGLDFDEVDKRYKIAYEDRTLANAELKRVSANVKSEPVKVEKPETIDALNKKKLEAIKANEVTQKNWDAENLKFQNAIVAQNAINDKERTEKQNAEDALVWLDKYRVSIFSEFIDFEGAAKKITAIPEPKGNKPITSIDPPVLIDTLKIFEEIEELNKKQTLYDSYERDLKTYNDWITEGKTARKNQIDADKKVKDIESEKLKMISGANVPVEFKFTDDGILYNGLPLSNNQLSSSAKYIAALKLGAMALGEVKTMHFDASFLDKNSLSEVEKWANENSLQLLIERPDFDGGEIKYEII